MDTEDRLEPPTECTVCGERVTRWNTQYLCKTCGSSWILVRKASAETAAILWFFFAVVLFAFAPMSVALPHFVIALFGCGVLAVRLKRHHCYRLVAAPEGGAPPKLPHAKVEKR